ncbi:sterol 14-demethylase [Cinnamomum micranthum f. kanehirae]|uniref:sterol 14alpha-demethylase n=1 Tax=Cinnamomum micranthum f. kanehirae TaxID=337451 RepID=A0A3S3R3F4_9MAGN|nr:sterol 14-demethylase [Cinnamomum micranthum f. kanehirae]
MGPIKYPTHPLIHHISRALSPAHSLLLSLSSAEATKKQMHHLSCFITVTDLSYFYLKSIIFRAGMDLLKEKKFLNAGLLFLGTIIIAKLLSAFLICRSRKRLPPTVKAWPVLGGLVRFMKGPIVMLREEYPKLGSVFTLNLLNKNITFFIGPEVSSHFFKAPESDLSQQEVYQFNVPTFGPGVVFDVDYSVRQEQFRFFTESLRVTKLKSYVDHMVVEAEDYFSKWGDSGEVDLKYELEHLIILTASRCLLGREVRDKLFDDVSSLFHDLDNGMLPISVIFPYLPIPAHRRRDQARKKLAEIFSNIISSRRCVGNSENDMLQCFIDSKYKDGRPTTDSEITGLLIAALFAGQHTSSITSTWTGAYLLRHSEFLSGVLEEQKSLMKQHGNRVDHDVLSEMDVLHRCIKEALRLHPPLILLLRSSHSDFTVKTREGKEYDIPKGHIVAASPAFANRLSHIYRDPDRYDPDRFAAGREEDKMAGPFSYISFGGGRHGCLGEPFAYLQIKAIWSHLLRNFELELISPFPEIDWNAMVVGVKGKVMVRYKRRQLSVG